MTVSSSFTDKVYQINGTSTVFPWAQDYDTQYGSLVVTEETSTGETVTTYTEGTDYNVIDGNVVFVTAPSETENYIRITRDTYKGQPVQFNEGEDFPAEDYEHSLDRLAMIAQEVYKLIQDEITKRIAADEALAEAITTEENRAKGVEGNLDNLTTTTKTNLVGAVNEVDSLIGAINTLLATYGDIVTHDADEFATAAQGDKADTAVQPEDLADVATSGDYDDLSNKPTIPDAQIQSDWEQNDNSKKDYIKNKPTISNKTITLTQGGVTKGSFNLNQTSDGTIDLDAGGSTSIPCVYKTVSATFAANSSSATIDVSDIVENGILYVPFFGADVQYTLTLDCFINYNKTTKLVTIHRNSGEVSSSLTVTGVLCLVSTNNSGDISAGLTNGQDYNQYNRSYSKAEEDNLLSGKQDSLSAAQLNAVNSGITSAKVTQYDGYATSIDTQNGTISNCILEIPQNIKCSIVNNVVTLDNGSILTNTGSSYSTTTLTSAQTYTIDSSLPDGNYLLCSNGTAIQAPLGLTVTSSGATNPVDGSTYTYFFNTTDKDILSWDGSAWADTGYCYPFAEITMANGVASFTKDSNGNDMIFNGAGFIGHHAFTYPNLNGLQSDGTNNGVLSSNPLKLTTLSIVELGIGRNSIFAYNTTTIATRNYVGEYNTVSEAPTTITSGIPVAYIKSENKHYQFENSQWGTGTSKQRGLLLLTYAYDGTTVTKFDTRQPYESARDLLTDEIKEQIGDIETALTTIIGA